MLAFCDMARARVAPALLAVAAIGLLLVSGGSSTDPRTPPALPEMPAPFLGTAVAGSGGPTAAIDAYGAVVDLRAPGPAGEGLIDNPADRQAAGSVTADTGIVPRVRIGDGAALPFWRADAVTQRYLPATNVVRTTARFGDVAVTVTDAAVEEELARTVAVSAPPGVTARPSLSLELEPGIGCEREGGRTRIALVCTVAPTAAAADRGRIGSLGGPRDPATVGERAALTIRSAAVGDRAWLHRARPLGPDAPAWAKRLYERSLLALRALTDRRTGAVAAGARDGWAYVWPRDAATAVLAFAAAGYGPEAARAARFLLGLSLDTAARFHGDGSPVEGRAAQGDAVGWVAVAARAAGLSGSARHAARILAPTYPVPWRERSDYREGEPGDFLANAIASTVDGPETPLYGGKSARRGAVGRFETPQGLVRKAGEPDSGLDSAAAWAVRPFPVPAFYPAARETLLRLAAYSGHFGITPGQDWPGADPWSAPTAWSAWSLAALGERAAALSLLDDLRRAATAAGSLPERVDARTGVPRSTTPLAWSHAFAILALRQLWPTPRA